jgi:hypothetical protein
MIADPRPGIRDFVANHLEFVLRYGDAARLFAEMGDDAGLEYSVRKLVEYTKVVATSTSDILKENQIAEAEARERAA